MVVFKYSLSVWSSSILPLSSPFFTPQNSKLSSKCLMLVVIKPPMEFQPKSEPKRSLKHKSCPSTDHQDLNFSDDNLDDDDNNDDSRRRPTKRGAAQPSCQAERCATALSEGKRYHRRHKVCEFHAKAPVAVVAGLRQRFCQQCSRFHELSEFDEAKRSCRRRLAGHNERRRKASTTSDTLGDGRKQGSPAAGDQCKVATDERVKVEMAHQTGNSTGAAFKHFQMR